MPLRGQRKILTKRKRKRSKSAPPVLQSPLKRIKRKQWTNEQMEKALEKVKSGNTSVNQAAKDHGVPPTTLKNRVSGRVEHNTNPGPSRCLNETEGKEFADFLMQTTSVGYGRSKLRSRNAKNIIVTSSSVAGTVAQSVSTILATPTTSVSPLANYLVHPVQSTTPTAPKRSVPQARLLTSDENLALLEQKENAKKMALLEKEKRKIEPAEKKQKRQEVLRQRKADRARKAEEKARLQQEKAKKQPTRGRKKSTVTDDVTASDAAITTTTAAIVSTTVSTVTSVPSTSIPLTTDCDTTQSTSEVIDPNKCCMCFVTYEDDVLDGAGAEWISCKCGRWLHEDCVEDVVKDSTGDERYCSFCIDKYTI